MDLSHLFAFKQSPRTRGMAPATPIRGRPQSMAHLRQLWPRVILTECKRLVVLRNITPTASQSEVVSNIPHKLRALQNACRLANTTTHGTRSLTASVSMMLPSVITAGSRAKLITITDSRISAKPIGTTVDMDWQLMRCLTFWELSFGPYQVQQWAGAQNLPENRHGSK